MSTKSIPTHAIVDTITPRLYIPVGFHRILHHEVIICKGKRRSGKICAIRMKISLPVHPVYYYEVLCITSVILVFVLLCLLMDQTPGSFKENMGAYRLTAPMNMSDTDQQRIQRRRNATRDRAGRSISAWVDSRRWHQSSLP
jgi:hypothetical protein